MSDLQFDRKTAGRGGVWGGAVCGAGQFVGRAVCGGAGRGSIDRYFDR